MPLVLFTNFIYAYCFIHLVMLSHRVKDNDLYEQGLEFTQTKAAESRAAHDIVVAT